MPGGKYVVDKVDAMLGSYGYQADVRTASVVQDEFPSGMLARGTYNVKSRVTDIDGEVWAGTFLFPSKWVPRMLIAAIFGMNAVRMGVVVQDREGLVNVNTDEEDCCWLYFLIPVWLYPTTSVYLSYLSELQSIS